MTDRKTIAEACATRIMDRMEMCRGSAILKSDIAREVESAIDEMMAEFGLVEGPTQECTYGVSPARIGTDNIVERAMKALGDQVRSEPDMALVNQAVYDALNQQIREHSGTPQSFWTSKAVLGLSEADRVRAQHDYLAFGQAVVFTDEDGNSKFVPMSEFAIEVAK